MADVITRFKLDSTQFDSKLRDSAKSLADLTGKLMIAGKDFDRFAAKNVEAARALGNIAPSATNAKDKVKELVTAYNDVAKAYNKMTVEQQNTDYGKALAGSLAQLKGKVTDAKQELYGLSDAMKNINSTSGILDQLAQKFTINIDALKLFELGMKAANVAVDVAKDAFFANEQQLDAWGAIVEESESLYKGFLNTLNTGDINGFLNNINQIVRAANSAYNALDALGTFNAFNQVNVEKTRTNMTESIVDYREGKGDKKAVRAAGDAYKKELEERRRLEQQAYIEAIGKVAAERGVSKQDLIDALSGSYGHYQDLKNVQPTGTVTKYSPGVMPGTQGSYITYTVAQGKQEKLGEALRQLNDTELQSLQALGAQAQRTGNEIAQVDRQLVRVLNGRQGGQGGGVGKTAPSWAPIAMQAIAGLDVSGLGRSRKDVQKVVEVTVDDSAALEQLRGIEGVTIDGKTFSVTATDAEALAKLNEIEGITIDDKTMTVTADTADALRALQGIEGVTIDPKTVTITATDEVLPKLREIEGITIDDKTMTVTADTADALRALQGIEGVTIDPKTVTITATDEVLPKLREIEGITIDDKTMTVTADTADALRALQGIEGVTINPKTVTITATDEALPMLQEIEGITIDDKTLTVTVTDDEAMSKLKEIEGVKLSDKVVDIVVNDNSDFLFGRSRQDVQKDLQRAQKAYDIAPDEWTRAEAKKDVTRYKNELETINGEGDVTKGLLKDAYTHDFSKEIDKLNKELKKDNDKTQATGMEQVKQMGAMLGGIQQMVGGIEMLGFDIPEGFQSMLNGMQGIMAILEAIQTINTAGTILGIFGNGGIVKAANGMIVPGNSYSGDNLRMPVGAGGGFIGINSGELILSRAQQDVIAGALGGVGEQSVNYVDTPYVDGEKIFLGVNNFLRRSGRGEIVTSRR